MLGYALGAFAGWFMPALHYGFGGHSTPRGGHPSDGRQRPPQLASASVVPFGSGEGLGIGVIGAF